MSENDISILKRAFCEFFIKLLPSIVDPLAIVRTRWHDFRDKLIDDRISPAQILEFVSTLNYGHLAQQKPEVLTDLKIPGRPKTRDDAELDVKKSPGIIIPQFDTKLYTEVKKNNMIIKNASVKYNINSYTTTDIEETVQSIEKLEILDIAGKSKQTPLKSSKYRFPKETKAKLHSEIYEMLQIMRKNTRTLGCVYDRSFEINTSMPTQVDQKLIGTNYGFGNYTTSQQEQANRTFQRKNQREKSIKGISVYKQAQRN